ncbi:hypothetical protein LOOC260_105240 [Paucilactobacillus hokkaidonensis JCM 18461]|uniref:Uncharacterized protein n=2 Tax=Paucilactobacillus hokkaidonensis TaxID=1193095 RepID=A0A0A1GX93_9LACO|nr:hypothetical protein [Paucilactobacillus hokkaidonensis]KRO11367.1 hypothetical protein IV59_GL000106 [Paucilactobacillus hokkaidonensis]BAP85081.1 hypothetical protein LOOC260_105240 [Paucilactobacillus hokkaidonensis JCM 18461]
MKDLISDRKLINTTMWILLVGVAFFGTMPLFVLIYYAFAIFMIMRTAQSQFPKRVKIWMIVAYLVLAVLQIVFAANAVEAHHFNLVTAFFSRVFAAAIILLPLAIERIVVVNKKTDFYLPSIKEVATVSFEQLNTNKELISHSLQGMGKIKHTLSTDNLKETFEDLHRHSSTRYINNGSLTDDYFKLAEQSLSDPYIYLVISNTGSSASEIISLFTQKQYNHASISFDADLKTIISYNGGEKVYPPGLNAEMVEAFHKKDDASVLIYRLPTTTEQKQLIINKVKQINSDGSAYNLLGLVIKHSYRPNIMFCSQFVYQMLKLADLEYFDKPAGDVRPTDFIELDYYKKLEFCYEIKF